MRGDEKLTCVWIGGVCSLRAGTISTNNVEGRVGDKSGPRNGGRVRGT